MKILVFSDVHGNLPAFKKMLESAGQFDEFICLGDVVGYGPWGNECVDLVSSLGKGIYLEGNHERDYLQGVYSGTNEIAKIFFDHSYPSLNNFTKIKDLKKSYFFDGYIFTHTILNRNIYQDSKIILDNNYVIGHSHHQFKMEQGNYILYNAGSVGQNRGYINVVNYMLYDSLEKKFEMKSVIYDVSEVINEMETKKYPAYCVDYYKNKKRWKN